MIIHGIKRRKERERREKYEAEHPNEYRRPRLKTVIADAIAVKIDPSLKDRMPSYQQQQHSLSQSSYPHGSYPQVSYPQSSYSQNTQQQNPYKRNQRNYDDCPRQVEGVYYQGPPSTSYQDNYHQECNPSSSSTTTSPGVYSQENHLSQNQYPRYLRDSRSYGNRSSRAGESSSCTGSGSGPSDHDMPPPSYNA